MVVAPALDTLNSLDDETINIIDVGCNTGPFIKEVKPHIKKKSYWIGIDPTDHKVGNLYELFLNKAISNVKEDEKAIFTEYNDSGCNSLLDMNTDIITHDRASSKDKWFIDRVIEEVVQKKEVVVTSLERVLNDIPKFEKEFVHYVKIDTQGNDINVARSLGKYLRKTMFIQLECVTSHDPKKVLYKGQQLLENDIDDMRLLGFSLMNVEDYSGFASPEGDALFVNNDCL